MSEEQFVGPEDSKDPEFPEGEAWPTLQHALKSRKLALELRGNIKKMNTSEVSAFINAIRHIRSTLNRDKESFTVNSFQKYREIVQEAFKAAGVMGGLGGILLNASFWNTLAATVAAAIAGSSIALVGQASADLLNSKSDLRESMRRDQTQGVIDALDFYATKHKGDLHKKSIKD